MKPLRRWTSFVFQSRRRNSTRFLTWGVILESVIRKLNRSDGGNWTSVKVVLWKKLVMTIPETLDKTYLQAWSAGGAS